MAEPPFGDLSPAQRAARIAIVIASMDLLGQFRRAIWIGDEGNARCGHHDDTIQMLADLNISSHA